VLDTTTGKPAADIVVTLNLISPAISPEVYRAITNSDGRVTDWNVVNDPDNAYSMGLIQTIEQAKQELKDGEQLIWSLNFQTGDYFGDGNTFWPEVELRFFTKPEEAHYHVPLLLGPWSYTTYRGS